jgi:hypothetical protein
MLFPPLHRRLLRETPQGKTLLCFVCTLGSRDFQRQILKEFEPEGLLLTAQAERPGVFVNFFRSCRDRSNSRLESVCTFDSVADGMR